MFTKYKQEVAVLVVLCALLTVGIACAYPAAAIQSQPPKDQQVPDAPSAVRPPPTQFPAGTKPAPVNQPRAGEAPVNTPEQQTPTTEQPVVQPGAQPAPQITTAPPGKPKDPAAEDTGREPFQV